MWHLCFLCVICTVLKPSKQYENLALGKNVTVSKRYNNKNFDPSLAVDGDFSTNLLKCTLTASGQKEAWLTVDLESVKNIAAISFLHGGFGINSAAMDPNETLIYPASNGYGTVRFIRNNTVVICPIYFPDRLAKIICLNWGHLPDNNMRYLVSAHNNLSFEHMIYWCTGDEVTLKDCFYYPRPCCHNGDEILLSCKSGNTLVGFSVYVSDTTDWKSGTLCYQHDMTKTIANNVSVDCFTTGRYVTIYNSRTDSSHPTLSDFAYINICEINVTGCDIGYYGEQCKECPKHCLNNTCHMQKGECFDCEDGYSGPNCTNECREGRYGSQCSLQCGSCQNEETCNHVNGSCTSGCSPGWKGAFCDQMCETGSFGLDCNSTCNNTHCLNSTDCEAVLGHCAVECINGWVGPFCEECGPTYYGEQCNKPCSEFCLNKLCNKTTGYCFSCIGRRNGVFCENEIAPNTVAATFRVNVGFIATSATSVILSILVIGNIIYVSKRKCCKSSKNTPVQNCDLPTITKSTTENEDIQGKLPEGGNENTLPEYFEIGIVNHIMLQNDYENMALNEQ